MSAISEVQQHDLHRTTKEHQARHKQRIRVLRGIQHLLTALVSMAVAVMQGRTYIIYEQTKNVPEAWPAFPDLLPTLLLFSTAVAATMMDICALIAYVWPQTRAGSVSYKLATQSRYVITTIKSISYTYSTVVHRISYTQGNSTGQNNDLWSWSCSAKADTMASVNQATSNCLTNAITYYLSLANIGVEIIGMIIDTIVKVDEARWKKKLPSDDDPDVKPLLLSSTHQGADGANNTKHKYSKITDEQFNKLDKYGSNADKFMQKQSSSMMDNTDQMDMEQSSYGN